MLNLRRSTLDAVLLEAAAQAGAEVRTRTAVTGLVSEGGRVTGLTTRNGDTVRARLVVGADGARSRVAGLVGAAEYRRTPPGRVFLWAYFRGAVSPPGHVWLGKIGDHGYLASPTDDDLFMVAVAPSMARRAAVIADPAGAHRDGLVDWPELEAALAPARRHGPVRTMPRWRGFFRESAGPGWVLVGDAGHVKDPTPGQGIADALRQTTALATAVVASLDRSGPHDLDRALADWWAWRDRDAWPMYRFARDMGAPGPTPLLVQQMQRHIARDPALVEALLHVLNHDLDPARLFTAPRALAALAAALRTHPGRRVDLLREAWTLAAADLWERPPGDRARRVVAA